MLWVAFAVMTGAAVLCALWPLTRAAAGAKGRNSAIAFHQAQLAEIDRDVERGQLPAAEAAAARAEAARRLIAAADRGAPLPEAADKARRRRRAAAAMILVLIPAATLGLYARLGSPNIADQPLLSRADDPNNPDFLEASVAKIEKHLIKAPDDGQGYLVIAPAYMRLGRYDDAAKAYGEALRLLGDKPSLRADYGEALVTVAGGVVTAEARAAFEQSYGGNPNVAKTRVYLGLAAEQDGDTAKAVKFYQSVLDDDLPLKEVWTKALRQRIAMLGGGASSAPPNSEAAAISKMDPQAQQIAIRGMVDKLAARLAQNGDDQPGWLRLIRAWHVLQEDDKARAALAQARKALTGHADAPQALDALAQELGIGS
jgi:cytochrome c-type biogenesis protein CcmH